MNDHGIHHMIFFFDADETNRARDCFVHERAWPYHPGQSKRHLVVGGSQKQTCNGRLSEDKTRLKRVEGRFDSETEGRRHAHAGFHGHALISLQKVHVESFASKKV